MPVTKLNGPPQAIVAPKTSQRVRRKARPTIVYKAEYRRANVHGSVFSHTKVWNIPEHSRTHSKYFQIVPERSRAFGFRGLGRSFITLNATGRTCPRALSRTPRFGKFQNIRDGSRARMHTHNPGHKDLDHQTQSPKPQTPRPKSKSYKILPPTPQTLTTEKITPSTQHPC